MRLSLKIFLGICIPAISITFILVSILVTKSFNTNLEIELNLYMQEFQNIINTIEDSTNDSMTYEEVVKYVADYYKEKDIYLAYYKDKQLIYSSDEKIKLKNMKLLDVMDDKYNTIVEKSDDDYYSFLAIKVNDKENLVYIRDLNYVYNERANMVKLGIFIVVFFILFISITAYIISKTLTKPLLTLKKEMVKLSNGNYNVSLKEGKDEIGLLVHEFNNMSKELAKSNAELLEQINSKQLFIDNLSHEMNTPLTSISGYSDLLINAILTEKQRQKYLTYIKEETKRISEMYKKLLVISYKENNNNIDIVQINCDDIFGELERELQSELKEKKIKLAIDNQLSSLNGDKVLISLAISNLVRNAIDASLEDSLVTIKAYQQNHKKYIVVTDFGRGIAKDQIAKIVEPFYRIDKARSRKNGGAGLGLSIVTRVMQLHHGQLKITSEIGKGSSFILEFNV